MSFPGLARGLNKALRDRRGRRGGRGERGGQYSSEELGGGSLRPTRHMEEGMDIGSKLAWRISSNRNLLESIEAPHPQIPEAVWAMPSSRCCSGDKMVRSQLTTSSVQDVQVQ